MLWDLDNVVTKRRHLPELAVALARLAGPQVPKIAAGRRSTARLWSPMLSEHGFDTRSGGTTRSGADRQLLECALQLHREGANRFILVSNDGDLTRLARWGELIVVTLDRTQLSRKLVASATSVVVLTPDTGLGTCGHQYGGQD